METSDDESSSRSNSITPEYNKTNYGKKIKILTNCLKAFTEREYEITKNLNIEESIFQATLHYMQIIDDPKIFKRLEKNGKIISIKGIINKIMSPELEARIKTDLITKRTLSKETLNEINYFSKEFTEELYK